jgi:membrane protease YdiL (CAAX protease family)
MSKRIISYFTFYLLIHLIFVRLGILRDTPLLILQCTSYITLGICGLTLFRKEFSKGLMCYKSNFLRNFLWLAGALILEKILANLASIPAALLNLEDFLGGNTEGIAAACRVLPFPLILLSIGVLGPIVEEIIFRVILVEKLSHKWNSILCITISSIAFMLIHLKTFSLTGLVCVLPQLTTGIVYGVTYHKTKNITLTVIIHVLNNSLALLMMRQL